MFRLVLLCAVVALVSAETTPVSRCLHSNVDVPYNTYVEGCAVPPCRVQRGGVAVIHMIFRVPHFTRTMTSFALAQVPVVGTVDWPLGSDAVTCNFLTNAYCPILADEVIQYTLRMTIPTAAPAGVSATIEFSITDDNNKPITCSRMAVSVQR